MAMIQKLKFSLQKKFIISIALIIVPTIGSTFAWIGVRNNSNTMTQVINQARILSRQIIITRQWVSDSGGVLVSRSSKGAQSTHYFLDDRVNTLQGTFNRFTPSMVTKKLSDYSMRENLYHFRLASLNPMNPKNKPDSFEKMALLKFIHQQSKEIYSFNSQDDDSVFRYTVPLYVDKACMGCHKDFSDGTLAGCLSIFLPSQQVNKAFQVSQLQLVYSGIALTLITTFTLFFLLRHVVIKPVNQLKSMADDIKNGNLDARVTLTTNDEFQRLGTSFNSMGQIMEEKILKQPARVPSLKSL